jgi:hypothetical protein
MRLVIQKISDEIKLFNHSLTNSQVQVIDAQYKDLITQQIISQGDSKVFLRKSKTIVLVLWQLKHLNNI